MFSVWSKSTLLRRQWERSACVLHDVGKSAPARSLRSSGRFSISLRGGQLGAMRFHVRRPADSREISYAIVQRITVKVMRKADSTTQTFFSKRWWQEVHKPESRVYAEEGDAT